MASFDRVQPAFKRFEAIAPSDTVAQAGGVTDAIYVGGAGIVQVIPAAGGSPVPFTCPAGTLLRVSALRVNLTSTTATLMVAMYQR